MRHVVGANLAVDHHTARSGEIGHERRTPKSCDCAASAPRSRKTQVGAAAVPKLPPFRGSCIASLLLRPNLKCHWPRGGVVTQRSAKPFTPVQSRPWPPLIPKFIPSAHLRFPSCVLSSCPRRPVSTPWSR